jgi:hypothetical protein
MRAAWIDATAGAAGDMLLGALLDAGASWTVVRRALARLPVRGFTLATRRIVRAGLAGRRVDVRIRGRQVERGLADLTRILSRARLEPRVERRALEVFRRLVAAEARAHGRRVADTHLHEAGGIDAVVDVVGTLVALDDLGVERVVVSPMTTGFGTVRCAHGELPVPAPATALLVRGAPVVGGTIEAERLTPTGAALLTTLADAWGALPPMRPIGVGYGAGAKDLGVHPNMLRVVLGDLDPLGEPVDEPADVIVLECALDDVSPQVLAYASERVLAAGALDVSTAAIAMKKGRSGHRITALARPEAFDAVARAMLVETSTLGLRYRRERRIELEREVRRVSTRWGAVRVKIGRLGDRMVRVAPEYDDCVAIARRHAVPLGAVEREALAAFRRGMPRASRRARGTHARTTRRP